MTAETALSGRALDRALAEAMGWGEPCDAGAACMWDNVPSDPHWHEGVAETGSKHAPRFHASVDALIAGPEARLPSMATMQSSWRGSDGLWRASWTMPNGAHVSCCRGQGGHLTEPEARALAVLAALALREEQG